MNIRTRSTWKVISNNFKLGIGSHTQNPNASYIPIPAGSEIIFDDESNNGNVWFYFYLDGKHRGKIEAGTILNLIPNDIELIEEGDSFIIYNKQHVNRHLNRN